MKPLGKWGHCLRSWSPVLPRLKATSCSLPFVEKLVVDPLLCGTSLADGRKLTLKSFFDDVYLKFDWSIKKPRCQNFGLLWISVQHGTGTVL